jgi:CTP:molybdopterin cytidylyltransferase MocA
LHFFIHCITSVDESMSERIESDAIGCYANFLVVGHNAFEFVMDFGQVYAGDSTTQAHTRIVTAPAYARAMLETLRAAVEQFEAEHGSLPAAETQQQ